MILYHGSNQEIDKIDLNQSRPHKDFGQGFYLTEDASQAMRMAEQKVLQLGGIPVVHAYAFDESHLYSNSLNVKIFHRYTEEWARFIVANRDRRTGDRVHHYDIVVGAIANDKVGVQLFRYLKEYIDLPTLVEVYTSDAYAKLSNTCTGLYYQSPGYVYDLLKDEFASSATNTPTVS